MKSRVRALLARHRAFGKWQAAAPASSAKAVPRIAGFAPRTLAFPSASADPGTDLAKVTHADESTDFRAQLRAALRRQGALAAETQQASGDLQQILGANRLQVLAANRAG